MMADREKVSAEKTESKAPKVLKALAIPLLMLALVVALLFWKLEDIVHAIEEASSAPSEKGKSTSATDGTWRFIVSGDSRNCGDVVMPSIAAHSAKNFQPAFYWHLGDLRAIYLVDDDITFVDP